MDLVDRVATALERSVLPSVIARGGTVRVVDVQGGVATLEVRGSPGAVLPLASRIQQLLRAAVPELTGVRLARHPCRTATSRARPKPRRAGARRPGGGDQPGDRRPPRSGDPGRGRPGLGSVSAWRAAVRAAAWRR